MMSKVSQDIIKKIEQAQLKSDVPAFGPGDTVVVKVRVKEGEKERLQAYEGVVIAKRNRGLHSSFTVRKISSGEGVERVFQTHSTHCFCHDIGYGGSSRWGYCRRCKRKRSIG